MNRFETCFLVHRSIRFFGPEDVLDGPPVLVIGNHNSHEITAACTLIPRKVFSSEGSPFMGVNLG